MNVLRPIAISGGGLAGLSLGLALRREGVPVTLFEAGSYPRHRVCGEFITGLGAGTRERLGLDPLLADALGHRDVAWFHGDRAFSRQRLPAEAWAISRHVLDDRLAREFVAAGGRLFDRTRAETPRSRPGWVDATGRNRTPSAWIGLKLHVRGLALECGLEMHLGGGAYVGLCQLPGDEVNVCGLFLRRGVPGGAPGDVLNGYLRAAGLTALEDRLAAAEVCAGSEAAVAGLGFGRAPGGGGLRLGDAFCMLPPFFGNGMAAAFQMAEEILAPLSRWARGSGSWAATCAVIDRSLTRRFRRRVALGRFLHPLVTSSPWQHGFALLARARCVPFGLLYQGLH